MNAASRRRSIWHRWRWLVALDMAAFIFWLAMVTR